MGGRTAWVALVLLAAIATPVCACDTPVFRVALFDPRWRPHPYEFTIIRDGKLPRTEQKILHRLDGFLDKHSGNVNYTLDVVELAKQKPVDLRDLCKVRRLPGAWPQLVVSYPALSRIDANLWAGPLREAPVDELLSSPARTEVAKRVLAGETAVWVLIESGNQDRDDTAFAVLSKELKKLEANLKLPEPGPGGKKIAIPDWAPEARIAFSALRLSRTDPAERWLVAMLLGLESDLDRYAAQPIAFAVFGRGNVLEPLIGKGITPGNIARAMAYIAGPCTCEDKAANPVKDLLMVADWEHGRTPPATAPWFGTGEAAPPWEPAVPGTTKPGADLPTTAPPPAQSGMSPSAQDGEETAGSEPWLPPGAWVGLGGLAVIGAFAVMAAVRRKCM
jgi:hypothetical protein